MEIVFHNVSDLKEYENNARLHDDEQITQLMNSIRKFGFTDPIEIGPDLVVISGHARLKAARQLGIQVVPTIPHKHLDDKSRKAYILAANRIAQNATWSHELVKNEISFLDAEGFDLKLTGFSDEEIKGMLQEIPVLAAQGDPDDIVGIGQSTIVQRGDIWVMGPHRLMCGDSTMIDEMDRLRCNIEPDMIFTDPPYGMSYKGGREKVDAERNWGEIKNDSLAGDELVDMVGTAIDNCWVKTKADCGIYVCLTWRTYPEFKKSLENIGLNIKQCIVWDKGHFGLGYGDYRPQHEFIFYCGGKWYGDKAQSDMWTISRGSTKEYDHPTQKPVELVERALLNSSRNGDTIIDPFGGSGTTLIACEKNGRRCLTMELDEKYCDVIIRRWQKFTGRKAYHAETGEEFNG